MVFSGMKTSRDSIMDVKRRSIWHPSQLLLSLLVLCMTACNQWAFPRIDPTGQRIFVPGSTTTLAPDRPNCLQRLRGGNGSALSSPALNPAPVATTTVGAPLMPAAPVVPVIPLPQAIQPVVVNPTVPLTTKAPPCEYQGAIGSCLELRRKARELGVPADNPYKFLQRAKRGELHLTPAKIVAPVGSEVVVMGGICGGDGYFVPHQPIEFNLSQDSAGQITDTSSRQNNPVTRWLKASTRKDSIDFVNMSTSMKDEVIDRGTPTPVDDIHVQKGQAWITVSSASPGTSYITAIAPKTEAWDKRMKTTEIQWVDALWNIPTPVTATAGAKYPLTTMIRKADDGLGVDNWKVRYAIAGGAPAEFLPAGSQTAEVVTGPDGNASVEIQQPPTETGPGTTFIRVDIIRPSNNSAGYEVIESAVTQIRWVAAALTIRAIGPKTVAIDNPFSYRLEITNPGDQVARESQVILEGLPEGLTFVGSTPKPTEYGDRLVWDLGDVPPGTAPNIIDLQFRSQQAVGLAQLCFDVESKVDLLKTRACAETQIVAPCLGVSINGPEEARVGDEVEFVLTIVNRCQEDLTGIFASVRFGSGIEAVGKPGTIEFKMDRPLKFGESKTLPLTVRVQEEGNHCFQVDMQADGGHTASIRRCIVGRNVNEPSVKLEVSTPVDTTVNQEIRVAARVTNTGNVPLTNVRLFNAIPFSSLDPLGAFPEATMENDVLVANLGTIAPGAAVRFDIAYRAIAIDGNAFSRFNVQCDQQVQDLQETQIRIAGSLGNSVPAGQNNTPPITIPGGANNGAGVAPPLAGQLGVSLLPTTSRVRREEPFTMEIRVTNQRATSDQNLRITLDTPPGIQLVRVVSPQNVAFQSSPDQVQHEFTGRTEIRAGESASIFVELRATALGSARVTAQARTDSTGVWVDSVSDLEIVP